MKKGGDKVLWPQWRFLDHETLQLRLRRAIPTETTGNLVTESTGGPMVGTGWGQQEVERRGWGQEVRPEAALRRLGSLYEGNYEMATTFPLPCYGFKVKGLAQILTGEMKKFQVFGVREPGSIMALQTCLVGEAHSLSFSTFTGTGRVSPPPRREHARGHRSSSWHAGLCGRHRDQT